MKQKLLIVTFLYSNMENDNIFPAFKHVHIFKFKRKKEKRKGGREGKQINVFRRERQSTHTYITGESIKIFFFTKICRIQTNNCLKRSNRMLTNPPSTVYFPQVSTHPNLREIYW